VGLGIALGVQAVSDGWLISDAAGSHSGWLRAHDWSTRRQRSGRPEGWCARCDGGPASASLQACAARVQREAKAGIIVAGRQHYDQLDDEQRAEEVALCCSPVPIALVSTAPHPGGIYTGYNRALLAIARSLPAQRPRPQHVATIGDFFHRGEADCRADLQRLKQLYKVAGLKMLPALPSGGSYASLGAAMVASHVVTLPYAAPISAAVSKLWPARRQLSADLPMGIAGTRRWLADMCRFSGSNPRRAALWADRRLAAIQQELGHLDHRNRRGLSVAVLADTPLAAGLTSLLLELGVAVPYVGLLDRVFGGRAALLGVLERNSQQLPAGCVIDADPSLNRIRTRLTALAKERKVHAVAGSCVELDLLRHDKGGSGWLKRVALLETGFPSVHRHAVQFQPSFGFAGVQAWAQRLLQVVSQPRLRGSSAAATPSKPLSKATQSGALRTLALAKMTGASLATHAIGDGFLLQHVGVGCKYKSAAQIARHDWGSHPNRREGWTQVGEMALIRGSAERLGPFARSWFERRNPGFITVVSSYFIELTGEDLPDEVRQLQQTLPCPVGFVPTAAPHGGFFDGYASVMAEICERMAWGQDSIEHARRAATLGFFFHRYEMDQKADLVELGKLVKAAGLEPGPTLLSGATYQEIADANKSGFVVRLPYARPAAGRLDRILQHRTVVDCDLPIGRKSTARFLRTVAAASGATVDSSIAAQERGLDAAITEPMATVLRGARVALFAETPLAAGLAGLLLELDMELVLIGIRDEALGGQEELLATLARNDQSLSASTEIWQCPSLLQLRQSFAPRISTGQLDLIIGSTTELAALGHLRASARHPVALLEAGYPSNGHHPTQAAPTLGYAGIVVWVQRLLDALLQPNRTG